MPPKKEPVKKVKIKIKKKNATPVVKEKVEEKKKIVKLKVKKKINFPN